jgi:hypothetical protein
VAKSDVEVLGEKAAAATSAAADQVCAAAALQLRASAQAGNRRFRLLSALRAHTKAPQSCFP